MPGAAGAQQARRAKEAGGRGGGKAKTRRRTWSVPRTGARRRGDFYRGGDPQYYFELFVDPASGPTRSGR